MTVQQILDLNLVMKMRNFNCGVTTELGGSEVKFSTEPLIYYVLI